MPHAGVEASIRYELIQGIYKYSNRGCRVNSKETASKLNSESVVEVAAAWI